MTGADRREAIERSRRALGEMRIGGIATVLPFHRAVLTEPAFVADDGVLAVHTRWIETEFENLIEPSEHAPTDPTSREPRRTVTVEVNGKRVDVTLPTWGEALHTISGAAQRAGAGRRRPRGRRPGSPASPG